MDVQVLLDPIDLFVDLSESQFECFALQCLLFELGRFVVLNFVGVLDVLLDYVAVLATGSLQHKVLQHYPLNLFLDVILTLVGECQPEVPNQLRLAVQFQLVDELGDGSTIFAVGPAYLSCTLLRIDIAIEAHTIRQMCVSASKRILLAV